MRLSFVTVDVFTDRQCGGNPLAVVLNANGLATRQMQAIAAEFNLSETTFVLPPKASDHTAEVRIFTPLAEKEAGAVTATYIRESCGAVMRGCLDLA